MPRLFGGSAPTVAELDHSRNNLGKCFARPPGVQAFSAFLTGRSTSSVARALAAVKSVLTFGQQVGYLTFDVGVPVRLPEVGNELVERIVDWDEVRDLLRDSKRNGSPRDHAILVTIIAAACGSPRFAACNGVSVRPPR